MEEQPKEQAWKNLWEKISLSSYESHMQSDDVAQLQMLDYITKAQLCLTEEKTESCNCRKNTVAILGVAGGNGLRHVDLLATDKVYAIDINRDYLKQCQERYAYFGDVLQPICCDLCDGDVQLPACNLLICNLIIEYLSLNTFVNLLGRNRDHLEMISCVIQKNNESNFVSNSAVAEALSALNKIHKNIDEAHLIEKLIGIGMTVIKREGYALPNGKEFVRVDFRNGDSSYDEY